MTLFIEPGSPWENDYNESFNGKLRDDLQKNSSTISKGKGPDRTVEEALQHKATTQCTVLSPAGLRNTLSG